MCIRDRGKSTEIDAQIQYDNLLELKINEDYIVWADSSQEGGGRICAYDRATKEVFLVKEYVYALPTDVYKRQRDGRCGAGGGQGCVSLP